MTMLHPAFQPIARLVGSWKLTGRTLGSAEDNIFGETTIRPILDGAYLELRGRMRFKDTLDFESLEIVHYDVAGNLFPSAAYVNMSGGPGGAPVLYQWFVESDGTVIHRGAGATYRGRFSADDRVLAGGWRPDTKGAASDESAYDAVMTRL